ncbi:MAG: FecR domain-containing protein [Pseudomonadota bacterium]
MTRDSLPKTTSDITTEALSWIAQLETGEMSAEDITALKEWMGRSPNHYHEIRKMAKLSEATNVLTGMAGSINAAAAERRAAVSAAAPKTWWARPRAALAAAALCAGLSVIGLSGIGSTPLPSEPLVFATLIGEYEEQSLPDGSVVKLNTNSQVEVDFSARERRLHLLSGEAFFDVAHDPSKPFVVFVGDRLVEAVGTAFAVRWTDGDLSVTVSEGRVAFAPANTEFSTDQWVTDDLALGGEIPTAISAGEPVLLAAGQKILLQDGKETSVLANVASREIESELAWQDGILDFTQRPLEDIISEINRYTDMRIEIEDPGLGALEFGGIFRTGETEAVFDALELAFEIEVEQVSEKHVRIRRTQG